MNVLVQWTEPNDNGSPILGYKVYIRQSDDVTYTQETANCDVSATQCEIPIADLRDVPYSLPWGSNIYAKIKGYNTYGDSAMSQAGYQAVILTIPDPPTNILEVEASRTANSITLSWTEGTSNGGASVIDFRISFDQASDTYVVLSSEVVST